MSKIKEVMEDLEVFEQIDYYLSEITDVTLGGISDATEVRNWYIEHIKAKYEITDEQFQELLQMHYKMIEDLIEAGIEKPNTEYAMSAVRQYNYFRKMMKAEAA